VTSTEGRTVVYTDGACSGNPGPGGWGWVVPDGEGAYGGAERTTNQRMELAAVLEAVRALPGPLHIVSDSTYVVNCFRDSWWKGWLQRGWKNSQKKPVANRDLWEPLIELYQERDITFEWVKGHSGSKWNDRADELAVQGREEAAGNMAPVEAPATQAATPTPGAPAANGVADSARKIAVAGHRPPEIGGYKKNPTADGIRRHMKEIFSAKASMFDQVVVLTGLQLGTETLGAEAAIEAGVDFVAVLAFPDPSARWPKAAQQHFDDLIDQALDVVILDKSVPGTPAQVAKSFAKRDRWLQAEADEAVVVWDGVAKPIEKQLRAFEQALGDDVWVLEP
jgi:ribonuclease HI